MISLRLSAVMATAARAMLSLLFPAPFIRCVCSSARR
jgi:hypothetical protein